MNISNFIFDVISEWWKCWRLFFDRKHKENLKSNQIYEMNKIANESWLGHLKPFPKWCIYSDCLIFLKHFDRKLILMLQEKLQIKESQSNILAIKADWVIWSLFLAVQNGAFTATLREIFPFFASWFVNEVGQAISICTTKSQSAHCTFG